jgi:hypothetical protein
MLILLKLERERAAAVVYDDKGANVAVVGF